MSQYTIMNILNLTILSMFRHRAEYVEGVKVNQVSLTNDFQNFQKCKKTTCKSHYLFILKKLLGQLKTIFQ